MGLIERVQKFGIAGLFAITDLLVARTANAEELCHSLLKTFNEERASWQKRLEEERVAWEKRLEEERSHWERRFDEERNAHNATRAQLQAEQAKLINHLAGVTAAETMADSPAIEDALEKLLQQQMIDPLSAAIREAQDEDAKNFLFRQEEQQAAINKELEQMAASSVNPLSSI